MCKPKTEEIEDLIYDAWGMHVSYENWSWAKFLEIVKGNKQYSEFEIKMLKSHKTFGDWVEILMSPDYQYNSLFPTKRRVANYLLCTYGTGFGFKEGFIVKKADLTRYGKWEVAEFRPDIQIVVDELVSNPKVKETLQSTYEHVKKRKDKEDEEKLKKDVAIFGMSYKDYVKTAKYKARETRRKYEYGTVCEYSIISQLDKGSHLSYIKAGLDICRDIIRDGEQSNMEFARGFVEKFQNLPPDPKK